MLVAERGLPWNALRMHRAITPGIRGQTFANSRARAALGISSSGNWSRPEDVYAALWIPGRAWATLYAAFSFLFFIEIGQREIRRGGNGRRVEINRECQQEEEGRGRSMVAGCTGILISYPATTRRGRFHSFRSNRKSSFLPLSLFSITIDLLAPRAWFTSRSLVSRKSIR